MKEDFASFKSRIENIPVESQEKTEDFKGKKKETSKSDDTASVSSVSSSSSSTSEVLIWEFSIKRKQVFIFSSQNFKERL